MAKSKSGEENASNHKSINIALLAGLALLVLVLFAAVGAVIANSSTSKENTPALIADVTITRPSIQPASAGSVAAISITETIQPSPVKTTSPALLPSLTSIPTSTPAEQPSIPTPSPAVTITQPPTPDGEEAAKTKPSPLPTPVGVYSWTLKVPILMYHYISTPPADADKYRTDLSVAPDAFREQMA